MDGVGGEKLMSVRKCCEKKVISFFANITYANGYRSQCPRICFFFNRIIAHESVVPPGFILCLRESKNMLYYLLVYFHVNVSLRPSLWSPSQQNLFACVSILVPCRPRPFGSSIVIVSFLVFSSIRMP